MAETDAYACEVHLEGGEMVTNLLVTFVVKIFKENIRSKLLFTFTINSVFNAQLYDIIFLNLCRSCLHKTT